MKTNSEHTFEGYPDFFGALLLDEDSGTVECVIALNVLFVHLTGLQFKEGVNVKIFELWRVEYHIGQITVATLVTVGDACVRELSSILKRLISIICRLIIMMIE